MRAVELFAGAGGLALGASIAGFKPLAVVEWDRWACDTIRENRRRGYPIVADWPEPVEGDVRAQAWLEGIPQDIELVAGGPPCQPFSLGGKHRAFDDHRDMFPATVDVIRRVRPKAFIIENVKGLTRSSFHAYYQYIQFQLEFPELPRRRHEDWQAHYARLQSEHHSGKEHGRSLTYHLSAHLVNAADYGVPQRRERIFIVGFRHDLQVEWTMPQETHSLEALHFDQWVTGSYWDRVEHPKSKRPKMPTTLAPTVERLRQTGLFEPKRPWKTVREALRGLPDPEKTTRKVSIPDHRFQPGARPYKGHTGSPLDLPAKTLKAGDHGVPGGENMMVKDDGSPRYFTVREAARLQTFPDAYVFHGAWSETMRQLGNAVPVVLAQIVAASVVEHLVDAEFRRLGFRAEEIGKPSNKVKRSVRRSAA